MKWNQHVLRMPENRIPCKALQYRPQGKRDLGRPYCHVVAERELNTKLRMEEEEEEEDDRHFLKSL